MNSNISDSFHSLSNTAQRWAELERLRSLENLVKQHPEWIDKEPKLKELIKS